MATQVDLGKIRPVWKGNWAASTAYEQNDMVKVGVDSYICTAAHTSGSTFADTNWDVLAVGAEMPSQSGHSGNFLTTDGSTLSWGTVSQTGRIVQRLHEIDTTQYSAGTSWSSGKTWSNMSGITVGNDLRIVFNIYARNDDTNWGGMFTHLEFSSDGGSTWTAWRSDGYSSGNVMLNGVAGIGQSERTILVENWQSTQFRLRYSHRTYSGSAYINNIDENDLGNSSAYGTYSSNSYSPSNINPVQWARNSLLIEEIAR
jgi:hypothetical protein